jgi:hypothetical protein
MPILPLYCSVCCGFSEVVKPEIVIPPGDEQDSDNLDLSDESHSLAAALSKMTESVYSSRAIKETMHSSMTLRAGAVTGSL